MEQTAHIIYYPSSEGPVLIASDRAGNELFVATLSWNDVAPLRDVLNTPGLETFLQAREGRLRVQHVQFPRAVSFHYIPMDRTNPVHCSLSPTAVQDLLANLQ